MNVIWFLMIVPVALFLICLPQLIWPPSHDMNGRPYG